MARTGHAAVPGGYRRFHHGAHRGAESFNPAGQPGQAPLGVSSSNLVGVYRALDGGWQIREGQEVVAPEIKTAMAARINWGNLLNVVALPPQPLSPPKH